MNHIRRREILGVAGALALGSTLSRAQAQDSGYPNKGIRMVVPAAAGGATSIIARIVADRLATSLGQPFIMDYRGGGGGLIGVDAVAKAPKDGYTLLMTYGGPVGSGLALFKSMPFDPFRDLAPIARVAEVQLVMVASNKMQAGSVKDIIDYAKANPDKLSAAINSYGSMGHLLTEQFRLENNIKINSIPYKGSSQALADLVSGEVNICFDPIPSMQALIKGGRLKAMAVAGPRRSEMLPDVPTFSELGMPAMQATTWYALYAPAGTPKPIIDKLNAETEKILAMPEVKEQMVKAGAAVNYAPAAQLATFMRQEAEKWGRVAKTAGMQPE